MKSSDQILIEKYLCNELDAGELADFQARMAADLVFRQEVEGFEKAVRAVRLGGNQALRSKLASRGLDLDAEQKHRRLLFFGAIVLLTLVSAILIWFWPSGEKQPPATPAPAPLLPEEPREQEPPVAPPSQPPSVKLPSRRPIAQQKRRPEQLFAEYFKPYRDDSLEPSLRGDGDPTPEERFLQLYWSGGYAEAIADFEALPQFSKNKGDLQFLLANCLLQNGEAAKAVAILENMGRTRFQAEAKWLLALAFLKNGALEKAKALLQEISQDNAAAQQPDAKQLLRAFEPEGQ